MKQLSMQEAFDIAAAHMLIQNERSSNGNIGSHKNSCKYRKIKKDGTVLNCGVGTLIPKSVYTSSIENNGIINLMTSGKKTKKFAAVKHLYHLPYGFLVRIQEIHDYNYPSQWPVLFKEMAIKWQLDSSIVDTITSASCDLSSIKTTVTEEDLV